MFSGRPTLTARRVLIFLLALAASAPGTAEAGTYHQWGCRTPAGAAAPADGWDSGATPAAAVQSSCASGGSVGVIAGDATGVAAASMIYSPGPNLTATAATLWRSAHASQSVLFNLPPYYLVYFTLGSAYNAYDQYGGYLAAETGYGDNNGTTSGPTIPSSAGTPTPPFDASNRLEFAPLSQDKPAAPLKAEVGCGQWNGGNYSCDARYLLTAYDIKLRDDSAPAVGAVAGTLVNAAGKIDPSAGAVSGSRSVIVLGTDTGSGLYRVVVEVDTKEVASARNGAADAARCSPAAAADGLRAYVVRQPCPSSGSATATWDTTKVADGTHAVRVLLEDASGNATVVTSGQVVVRNAVEVVPSTPVGPTTPVVRGEPNGVTAGDGVGATAAPDTGTLALAWPGTARAASTSKASIRRCKQANYAAKHTVECKGQAAQKSFATSWSATKTVEVGGQLTDLQGNAITGATVVLEGLPAAVGASPRALATVTTNAAGAFSAAIPRASGSQVVRAQWTARVGDATPAAAANATLTVKAATALSAPKTVNRRSRVTFSGALLGTAGLLEKVPVRLQVSDGKRWWTFATASTDGAGKWKTTAKFANRPGIYTVRAKVDAATTYPFAPGGSLKNIRVHVR